MDTLSDSQNIQQFDAPKRILLGPGPSDVPQYALDALARPTIGHLDPECIRALNELQDLVRYAYQTQNEATIVLPAPATAGMEMCLVNLLEPGEKVIVYQNGVFGGRMKNIAERCGAKVVHIQEEMGQPLDPSKLEETLKAHPDTAAVAFVHAETSTGVRSDAEKICQIAKQYGALTIVDTVTSFVGIPLKVDDWHIDAVYTGSQKCLSSTPGLCPMSFSETAVKKIKDRKVPVQSFFMDLGALMSYWARKEKRAYHHTTPTNAMYALHESLLALKAEGLENSWKRHQQNHELLKKELGALGLTFFVEEAYRLPQLNAMLIPEGVDDAGVRKQLLLDFGIEIGGGLGPMAGKLWRIGLMGHSSRKENVMALSGALKKIL